jgi:hypothetical protein
MTTVTAPAAHTGNLQPILNWCNLLRDEQVTVYGRDRTTTTGRIDMVALDGSVFWIMEDDGNRRTMIHRNDGPTVYRRPGAGKL